MKLAEAYRLLEVEPGAARELVRESRNVLVTVWHPDKHQGNAKVRDRAEHKLQMINEAYALISKAGFPTARMVSTIDAEYEEAELDEDEPPDAAQSTTAPPTPPGSSPRSSHYPPPPPPPPGAYPPPPSWYPPPPGYPPPAGAYSPPAGPYPPPPPFSYPPPPPAIDHDTLVRLVRFATVVQEHDLWPDEVVEQVRNALLATFGRIPTLDELATDFGADLVRQVAKKTISDRIDVLEEITERMGYGSPCHLCRAARRDSDPTYSFALARIIEKKTQWGGALATLAMNLVTVPLGVAVGATPGSTTTANLARCRLVLCSSCGTRLTGFFGGLKITQAECQRHPSWGRLLRAGFETFLNHEEAARYE